MPPIAHRAPDSLVMSGARWAQQRHKHREQWNEGLQRLISGRRSAENDFILDQLAPRPLQELALRNTAEGKPDMVTGPIDHTDPLSALALPGLEFPAQDETHAEHPGRERPGLSAGIILDSLHGPLDVSMQRTLLVRRGRRTRRAREGQT